MSSDKLIDEYPLILLPSLAAAIGLNEAIVLQQVHYWVSNPKVGVVKDGRRWAWNKIAEWQEQFPFWSERTIRRVVKSARDMGCLLVEKHNDKQYDQTNYYSVDYDRLKQLISSGEKAKSLKIHNRSICPVQEGQVVRVEGDNVASSLTDTTADTSTDITSNSKESNTSCVTSAKADGEKTKKSPHKEKKESTARMYQHQIDADEYPYASNVMKLLNETLAKHESKGMVHRFAMDKRRHELTVNPSHLSDIEDNLSELGAYADDGDEYDYVFNKLIRLYNSRVIKSKTKLVNLAFLAGVNMPAGKDEFMDSEGYARWVNEFVLDGEE